MAEITDVLRLDIDQALRDIQGLETALDRALASVDLRVDTTQAENQLDQLARSADQALGDVDVDIDSTGAARLNDELAGVERNLAQADSEADQLTRSLHRADNAAEAIDVTSIRMVGRFDSLKTAAAGIAAALAAVGGIQLFGGVVRGANAAVQQFAVLEDSINAVNVIFGDASDSVIEFGESAAASAGLSQAAFNQAVTPIGSLLQNFGFDAREAADASVILVQRAADLASVLGGTVQEALLAVGAALRGEADPLERYGASISAARVEQFALAQGLAATKAEITPAITLQARYGLILEDTARVQGDFANTAGDLANAQRSAAAEASNVAGVFGEALAPAFEAILVQAVPLLNFFESLTPAIADSAEEASNAAASFTELATGIVLGLGALGDVIGGVGDALSAFPALIEDVAAGIADGDASFSNFGAQMDDFNQRTANQFIRIASQSIPAAIARGTTPINAFGEAIAFLAQQDDGLLTVQQSFERLAIQSGLADAELSLVTQSLIDQAVVLGLNAEEVAFLNDQLEILFNNTNVIGTEVDTAAAAMAGFGESLPAAKFTEFSAAVEGGREVIRATLETLAADNEAQQERIAAALDPFAELPEQIDLSAEEATAAIVAQFEAIAAFEANIALLAATAPNLAAELFAKGPAAADLVEDFLDTPALIEEAENALRGVPTAAVAALTEGLQDELEAAGLDPQTAAKFAAIFSNPSIITAVTSAGLLPGEAGVQGFRQGILDEAAAIEVDARTAVSDHVSRIFAQEEVTGESGTSTAQGFFDAIVDFDPLQQVEDFLQAQGIEIDLSGVGADSASSYVFGFQEEMASREDDLKEAVESATRGALQMESPSKLMMGLGGEAADSFALGFEQANLTLRLPTVPTGGLDTTGTMTGATGTAVGGGVNVSLTTINPIQQDEVSDVARMGQIASSIAASYRSVVPNGM